MFDTSWFDAPGPDCYRSARAESDAARLRIGQLFGEALMSSITRRQAVTRILSASALAVPLSRAEVFGLALPEAEITPSERQQMASVADVFMRKFDVPGLSVAIAREGRIVYESPFAEANRQAGQRLT